MRFVLDEPFKLATDTPLLVKVVAPDAERSAWANLAGAGLARAYGPDEPEYSAAILATTRRI